MAKIKTGELIGPRRSAGGTVTKTIKMAEATELPPTDRVAETARNW